MPPEPTGTPNTLARSAPLGDGGRWRWPRRCAVCRRWSGHALCLHCRQRFAPPVPRCRQCGLAWPAAGTRPDLPCGACLATPPAFDLAVAAADYGFPWDRLISRFKFEQSPELAAPLAALLADAVAMRLAQTGWPAPDWVLPVPLAPQRLAERGYNQAWDLARRLAPVLGLRASATLLERWRETPHQVGAGRAERRRNLADAFLVDPRHHAAIAGRRLALVDDVLTTGITAEAATRALRAAGAAHVQVWVIARTPPPDGDGPDRPAATIG